MVEYLTNKDLSNIVKLYEDRYSKHGDNYKTVGWGSKTDQILRFDMLCRGLNLEGRRILDVGCGLGDLVAFIDNKTNGNFSYTGIDLTSSLIESAKKKFKQPNVHFACCDVSTFTENKNFDIALLSGALNFKIDDNIGYSQSIISKLFKLTKETVSVNFLSSYVDYQEDKNFHHSPEEVFHYAKSLSKWVNLYHDYPLWEFTMQIHHNSIKRR